MALQLRQTNSMLKAGCVSLREFIRTLHIDFSCEMSEQNARMFTHHFYGIEMHFVILAKKH